MSFALLPTLCPQGFTWKDRGDRFVLGVWSVPHDEFVFPAFVFTKEFFEGVEGWAGQAMLREALRTLDKGFGRSEDGHGEFAIRNHLTILREDTYSDADGRPVNVKWTP